MEISKENLYFNIFGLKVKRLRYCTETIYNKDGNELKLQQNWPFCSRSEFVPEKIAKALLCMVCTWSHAKIQLISSSQFCRSILCMSKGTKYILFSRCI